MPPACDHRRVPATSLPAALDADRREIDGRSGRLSLYVAGEGPPLLLLHSINAAGSAYEVRPAFEHARPTHRVYAPDLPGYRLSKFQDCLPERFALEVIERYLLDVEGAVRWLGEG